MRRILLAFFISLFFLSGLFGFGVVRQVRAIAKREPVPGTPATQLNLILVHVDDLKLDRPVLTSLWGVFISRSVVPGLIMKRIYPEAGSAASARLAAAFSLDQQKQLDPKFLAVARDLDLPSAEIVLVDDGGIAEIAALLAHQLSRGSSIANPDGYPVTDREIFQDICKGINAPTITLPFSSPDNSPLESTLEKGSYFGFFNKWKGLVTSLHFASCEVLAGP